MASDAIYSVESLLAPIVEVNQLISIQQQSKDERATDFAEQLSKVKDILKKHGLSSAAALDNRVDFCRHNDDMEYCSMSIFVQGCLAMLENLKLHLTGLVQNNMPCMSVLQEQDILILLHFVVNVGLVRHFDFQVTLCAEQLENRPPCR
uniref:Uncharacterized protein n=1 Tax=Ciona savignyi TaxID=51511 RepID=H2ZPR0_CIOSA